jgi:hypothetical protein
MLPSFRYCVIAFYIYFMVSATFAAFCAILKKYDEKDYVSAIICIPLTYYCYTFARDLYLYELY